MLSAKRGEEAEGEVDKKGESGKRITAITEGWYEREKAQKEGYGGMDGSSQYVNRVLLKHFAITTLGEGTRRVYLHDAKTV